MFESPLRTRSSPIWDTAIPEAFRPDKATESTQTYPSGLLPKSEPWPIARVGISTRSYQGPPYLRAHGTPPSVVRRVPP